jgi:hypothetical protein
MTGQSSHAGSPPAREESSEAPAGRSRGHTPDDVSIAHGSTSPQIPSYGGEYRDLPDHRLQNRIPPQSPKDRSPAQKISPSPNQEYEYSASKPTKRSTSSPLQGGYHNRKQEQRVSQGGLTHFRRQSPPKASSLVFFIPLPFIVLCTSANTDYCSRS